MTLGNAIISNKEKTKRISSKGTFYCIPTIKSRFISSVALGPILFKHNQAKSHIVVQILANIHNPVNYSVGNYQHLIGETWYSIIEGTSSFWTSRITYFSSGFVIKTYKGHLHIPTNQYNLTRRRHWKQKLRLRAQLHQDCNVQCNWTTFNGSVDEAGSRQVHNSWLTVFSQSNIYILSNAKAFLSPKVFESVVRLTTLRLREFKCNAWLRLLIILPLVSKEYIPFEREEVSTSCVTRWHVCSVLVITPHSSCRCFCCTFTPRGTQTQPLIYWNCAFICSRSLRGGSKPTRTAHQPYKVKAHKGT